MRIERKSRLPVLGLNAHILLLVGLLVVATAAITRYLIKATTRRIVENAVGDQMAVQARIVAQLVAIAEQKRERGMTPTEINQFLVDIVAFAREQRKFDYDSADAMLLIDDTRFVECNAAAVANCISSIPHPVF